MTNNLDITGYYKVRLSESGVSKLVSVHRLVCEAFTVRPPLQVNHKDGDKRNNHWLNLEWVTSRENHYHAYRNGMLNKSGAFQTKLTEDQVLECRRRFAQGQGTIKGMARELGMGRNAMRDAVRGRSWTYLNPVGFVDD